MRGHEQDQGHEHDEPSKARAPQEAAPAELPHLLRAAATGRTDVLGPAGMSTLQRTVGNAAVRSTLQRETDAEPDAQGPPPRSSVHDVISSGGQPLDTDTRGDMETRLGADFSSVRVHTDSAAHASAKEIGAHAYTVGNNIVFQRESYDPSSHQGRTTLAHELTHVVQQRNGPVDGTDAPGGIRVSDPSDRFEQEASANAERVMAEPAPSSETAVPEVAPAGLPAPAATPVAAASVQRQAADEDEQPADVQGSFEQGSPVQRATEGEGETEDESSSGP
jgi:hypothetical protein